MLLLAVSSKDRSRNHKPSERTLSLPPLLSRTGNICLPLKSEKISFGWNLVVIHSNAFLAQKGYWGPGRTWGNGHVGIRIKVSGDAGCKKHEFDPWVGKIPWRRAWQPTPVFLPRKSHGQRNLVAMVHRVTKSRTWLKWLSMHGFLITSLPAPYHSKQPLMTISEVFSRGNKA